MPLQRTDQVVRTATDESDYRTRIRFYRADANATPPSHPRVLIELYVTRSDGKEELVQMEKRLADTTLAAGERTALASILAKLVGEAATDAGFVNVQALQGR